MKYPSHIAHCCTGCIAAALIFVAGLDAVAWGQDPYIATSQNYYCSGSDDEVSLYCNVLAFDPDTNVEEWTFEWSPADEVSDPTAQSVTIAPANTTIYSVEMVAPDGTVYSDEITITVYPAFSVIVDSEVAMCSTIGGQLEATADVVNAMDWQWEPATGLSNATISNPQILEELTQTYTVTATISGLGGASCTASAQVDLISIFPVMELGDDIVACSEQTVVLDPGLPVNYTFDWSVDGYTLPVLDVTSSGTYGLTAISPEGCVNSDAITVTFTDGPVLQLPDSATACEGVGLVVDAAPLDQSTGPYSYLWSNGSNASSVAFYDSESVQVQVTDAGGCTTTATVVLEVLPSPGFYLPSDTALCFEDFPDDQHQLSVPSGYAAYQWMNGSTLPSIAIDGPGVFSVVVTNDIGCSTDQSVTVIDFCSEPFLFVPTAFTPDGNGLNEVLRIEGRNLVQLDFKLYNRWGNLVWQADSIGDYWHGQGPERTHYVQDDLYLWRAKYRHYTDPSGQLSPWYQATGSVRIIR